MLIRALGLVVFLNVVWIVSVLWTHLRGAPWVPTPMHKVHKMLHMAEVGPGDTVYDLGCGDGRLVIEAARRFGARAVGIEIDPLRYLLCQLRITFLGLRDRVRIVHGDFFRQDLRRADVVTCFLLTSTNQKLLGKFKRELPPGARVVSNRFTFPGLFLVDQDTKADLFLYQLKTK